MPEPTVLEHLIDDTIEREGRMYTVDPAPTKYGVTQAEWSRYYGRFISSLEVSTQTEDDARAYYKWDFLSWPFWKVTDPNLQEFLFDFAVNSGKTRAVQHLQRAVGVADDGDWGPMTQRAVELSDPKFVLKGLIHSRMHLMIATALSDVPKQQVATTRLADLGGWWNRVWNVGVSAL